MRIGDGAANVSLPPVNRRVTFRSFRTPIHDAEATVEYDEKRVRVEFRQCQRNSSMIRVLAEPEEEGEIDGRRNGW